MVASLAACGDITSGSRADGGSVGTDGGSAGPDAATPGTANVVTQSHVQSAAIVGAAVPMISVVALAADNATVTDNAGHRHQRPRLGQDHRRRLGHGGLSARFPTRMRATTS